jgi:spore coat protein U-like protein
MFGSYRVSKEAIVAVGAGLALLPVLGIQAANLNVSANVQEVCQVRTATDVDFGNLSPGGGNVTSNGAVEWRCTKSSTADVTLNGGSNGDRTMDGPVGEAVQYQLYQDASVSAGGNIWGRTVGTDTVGVTGTGMSAWTSETVYGEVLAADYEDVEAGSYSDVVVVDIQL